MIVTMGLNAFGSSGWEWLNEPKSWSADDGLTVTADPDSDFWRKTHYGFIRDSGHLFGRRVEGDFTLTATFEGDYQDKYDQAGVALHLDDANWIKTGIELVDDVFYISAVVTREFSDWSVIPVASARRVTIAAERAGDTVTIRYGLDDDEPVTMLRLAYFPPAVPVLAGPTVAAPVGKGFRTRFERAEFSLPTPPG